MSSIAKATAGGAHQGVTGWLRALLLVCTIATLALFAATALAELLLPYGLDYGEGPLIANVQRLDSGKALYRSGLDEPPYLTCPYPPLYLVAIAAVTRVTSLPLLQGGRAISILSAIAAALILGSITWRLGESRLAALLSAALFLGHPFTMAWSGLARVDLMALALSLVGLWLLYTKWRSWSGMALATLAMLGAIYTRQSYLLAAPLAGIVWLWHNDRRRSLVFSFALASLCLLVFGLLDLATQGGFRFNVLSPRWSSYHVTRTLESLALLAFHWPATFAIAGVEIFHSVGDRLRRGRCADSNSPPSFALHGLLPYTLGATLSALTVGKVGSNVNYFLELLAALSIWIGIALCRQSLRGALRSAGLVLLVLCQLVWVPVVGRGRQASLLAEWRKLPEYDRLLEVVREAANEGAVLADDHLELIVLAGHDVYFSPYVYERAQLAGLWDPVALIGEIHAHRFPLIMLSLDERAILEERRAPQIVEAILEYYEPTCQLAGLALYRPREDPH